MKEKIIIFSKHFGFNVGGAERSIIEILKIKEREGFAIEAYIVENSGRTKAERERLVLPETWEIKYIRFRYPGLRWFSNFWYFMNKRELVKLFNAIDPQSIVYAYGKYAPVIINTHNGRCVYLVRDEYGLGWNLNYEIGIRYLRKYLHQTLDYFWFKRWQNELLECMSKADVIANSNFIADEVEKITQKRPKIILPKIDEKKLKSIFQEAPSVPYNDKGIVAIGGTRLKGADIVEKIAKQLPEYRFYIFAKSITDKQEKGNVTYMPWQQNIGVVYQYAKLVLVPSRWYEAYPRAAREPYVLGIPVLGSLRGGIPEALDFRGECLIDNPEDIGLWCRRIKSVLNDS
ncbi:MAG: glycosyltransferase family 4 protein [Desulfocapsa sp.]|nr:glycosyltransferase family 4 protein [Desulfocapsa sp.]MBN4063996.1 glycosyltransferase family 4 protein [bacterium AH-315-I07]